MWGLIIPIMILGYIHGTRIPTHIDTHTDTLTGKQLPDLGGQKTE